MTGLGVSIGQVSSVAVNYGASSLAAARFRPVNLIWFTRLIHSLESLSVFFIITFFGIVASYMAAQVSEGWRDHQLLSVDRNMGFNWRSYWNFTMSHDIYRLALDLGYTSINILPVFLIIALNIFNKRSVAAHFILTYALSLGITVIIFLFFPAKSAAVEILGMSTPNLPRAGTEHIPIIEALRNGEMTNVALERSSGLIDFPSFHASCAVMFAWFAWRLPGIRWVYLVLCGLMYLATPIQGGHYFIDVLAGTVIAFLCIKGVPLIISRINVADVHAVESTIQSGLVSGGLTAAASAPRSARG